MFTQPSYQTQQSPQYFQTNNVNQVNQNVCHVTYFVKVTEPPTVHQFRNYVTPYPSNVSIYQPSKSLSDSKQSPSNDI